MGVARRNALSDDAAVPHPTEDTLSGLPRPQGRRMALIAQSAGIGYWSVNRRLKVGRWSAEMRELHGLAADEPLPRARDWLQRYVHPDDRDATLALLQRWLAGDGGSMQHTLRIVRADGTQREVLTHSLAELADDADMRYGVVVDITSVRRTEKDLRHAENRASLTTEALGLGTWEQDLRTGRSYWDAAMWRLRGLTLSQQPPDLEGRLALVHPDDRERIRAIGNGNLAGNYEFRVVWPDGRVRWLASRSTVLTDGQGRPQRRIGINWDITAQREAEASLRERERALEQSRLRHETLAHLSHELRTPLNAILGCAQLLRDAQRESAAPQAQAQHLATIEEAGRTLLNLVDRVLALTREPESGATPAAVECPAADERPAVVAPRLPPPSPGPRHRLLYIEDNAVNAMIVRELAARRGDIETVVAETGEDGLRLAVELQPSLVLLDMQLPDIGGPEVFQRLRADPRTAAIPCIALSANVMHADIHAALQSGMAAYWTKPLDFRAFGRSLDELFGPAAPR